MPRLNSTASDRLHARESNSAIGQAVDSTALLQIRGGDIEKSMASLNSWAALLARWKLVARVAAVFQFAVQGTVSALTGRKFSAGNASGDRKMSAWIGYAPEDSTDEKLAEALEMAKTPHGTVDNVMRAHSLRPSTMVGHVRLYRAVLHDSANSIPGWLQETVGSFVSLLNGCSYSFDNHWSNAKHLINDPKRAAEIEQAIRERNPSLAFSGAELAMMHYAEKLTMRPAEMTRSDIRALRDAGLDDGEILEIVQIVGYFSYVNRHLNGLGVSTRGDIVGYYANSDGQEGAETPDH